MYEIIFYNRAREQFEKLPLLLRNRITSYLQRIRIRPFNFVKKLIGTLYYRGRGGEYRLILDIKKRELIVVELGHRRNIYK